MQCIKQNMISTPCMNLLTRPMLLLMEYRRFDDKTVDRQMFRRHGSDVSTTTLWTFRRQLCVNFELLK